MIKSNRRKIIKHVFRTSLIMLLTTSAIAGIVEDVPKIVAATSNAAKARKIIVAVIVSGYKQSISMSMV
jgi:hypothetical protein